MNFMKGYRVAATAGTLMAVVFLASGCLGPTYGTDKSSTEQLMDDLGNIVSVKPKQGPAIAYQPRPGIVKPPQTASLPTPQQSVSKNNPNWVEPPEATRERLIAEAAAHENEPGYRSPLATRTTGAGTPPTKLGRAGDGPPSPLETASYDRQSREFKENLKIQRGSYSDRRRFLSDPPLTYRQPADTAPVGDPGESERDKEKRRIAAATKPGTRAGWFKMPKMPWQ